MARASGLGERSPKMFWDIMLSTKPAMRSPGAVVVEDVVA